MSLLSADRSAGRGQSALGDIAPGTLRRGLGLASVS